MPIQTSARAQTYSIDITRPVTPILTGHLNLGGQNVAGESLAFDSYTVRWNDRLTIPVMGEFHYARCRRDDWPDALDKIKAGGVTIVATYVFWNYVEEEQGVFDWSGSNDLRYFIQLCGARGLKAIVRLGPFAHGECRNGGLPDWLYGQPFEVRSTDARFLAYTHRLYTEIAAQLDGLLFKHGGPVIGVQLDNEYMHCGAPWEVPFRQGVEWVSAGTEGAVYMRALKQLAQEVGLDVPLYTSTAWVRSPLLEGEMLPMQGGYAFTPWSPDPNFQQQPTHEFLFRDRHRFPVTNGAASYDGTRYPFAGCEIGSGIMVTYYHRPIVPPESVEAMAVMNLAGGANLLGYYMFHGGTHRVGRHSYMNEFTVPRLTYDFQAPVGEFGQIRPSFNRLRLLHTFLSDFGALLAPMRVMLPDNAATITPEDTAHLRYAARALGDSGFVFINNYQDHVELPEYTGVRLHVQTANGPLVFPRATSMTVARDSSAILPFGLSLDGLRLEYATTQLLARLAHDGETTYLFFAPHRMPGEYAFARSSYQSLAVEGGEVAEDNETTVITVSPGLDCALSFTLDSGQRVRILTLTREQAEHTTRQPLRGQERFIIADAALIQDVDTSYFTGPDAQVDYQVFPALAGPPASRSGLWSQHTAAVPAREITLAVEKLTEARAVVQLPPDLYDGVSNVLLRVDYTGDTGGCFIEGQLVHDNFWNGTPWEIGLRQMAPQPEGATLLLHITALTRTPGSKTFTPTGMAFYPDVDRDQIARIDQITAVPVYRIALS